MGVQLGGRGVTKERHVEAMFFVRVLKVVLWKTRHVSWRGAGNITLRFHLYTHSVFVIAVTAQYLFQSCSNRSVPIPKLFAWGQGDGGEHLLLETTSRGCLP